MNDVIAADEGSIEDKYPLVSDTGKRYRMLDEVRREYASGMRYNEVTKRAEGGMIRSENAVTMQSAGVTARYQNAIDAARRGLMRGVSATQLASDEGMAWEHIIAAQTELALAVDMGNASTRAAEFVGKAADLLPDRRVTADALPNGVGARLDVSPDVAAALLAALDARRREGS